MSDEDGFMEYQPTTITSESSEIVAIWSALEKPDTKVKTLELQSDVYKATIEQLKVMIEQLNKRVTKRDSR